MSKEETIPIWMTLLMMGALLTFLFVLVRNSAIHEKEERQKYLRESFSRLSTDPEVQEAYEAINHQN